MSEPAATASTTPPKSASRAWLRYTLRFLVSVLLLGWLIRSISWSEIRAILAEANGGLIMAGVTLALPIVILKGLKWRLMLHQAGIAVSLRQTVVSYLAGLGFGLVTPGRTGELARIGFLGVGREVYVRVGVLVVVDRLTDLLALAVLIAGSVGYFLGPGPLAIYLLLGAAGGAGLWWFTRAKARVDLEGAGPKGLPGRAVAALRSLRFEQLFVYSGLGLVVTMIGITMVFTILNALTPAGFSACLVGLPLVFINSLLPVSVGGVGVREVLMTFVFGRLGIPDAAAISAILIYFVFSMALPGMIGLVVAALFKPAEIARARSE